MIKKLLIFADNAAPIGAMRGIGAYRLRTAAKQAGYQATVVDMLSEFLEMGLGQQLIDKFVDKDTIVAFSTTWFLSPVPKNNLLQANGSIMINGRNKIPCGNENTWFEFLDKIKQTQATVVFGGPNIFYYLNPQYKGLVDFFIVGYGDRDIVDLLNYKSGKTLSLNYTVKDGFGIIKTDNNFLITDIATKFLPEDYLNHKETLPIEISRGCRFKCKFCYFPLKGRKKNDYVRDSEDLYQEFMYNFETFGTTKYRFVDDTYNESIEKLKVIDTVINKLPFELKFESYIRHELMNDEQLPLLKSSGLNSAILGIETLNRKNGTVIGKGMKPSKSLKIVENFRKAIPDCYISSGMIIGLPFDTKENLNWAYELAARSDLFDKLNWAPLTLRPKSALFTLSELEEDPASYGYNIEPNQNNNFFQIWTNRYGFTWQDANNVVAELETLSTEHATFKTNTRHELAIENVGITSFATTFKDLDIKIVYNTMKYKRKYVKNILGEK